ncbi:MAG: hypothetical protein KF841_00545 [Phycisphaerae bacterium]|nr:hypothetical protein [Phycisphaerae bacterium]
MGIVIVCLIVGAFMVHAAVTFTVFDDEALSCRLYAVPLPELLRALWRGDDPDPPFYYLIQHVWVWFLGVSPLALRGMSILFFLAGILVLRRAAAAWFDARVADTAFLLAALHPAHLFFGFAGRWYSLVFLLLALLLRYSASMPPVPSSNQDEFVHGGQADNRKWHRPEALRRGLLWGGLAAAVCYTNYFGPVMVGLIWLCVMVRDRSNHGALAMHSIGGVVAAVLYAPWVPVFWHHVVHFPPTGGGVSACLSSSIRIGMTLLAGNLAGPTAYWVWVPFGVAAASGGVALWRALVGAGRTIASHRSIAILFLFTTGAVLAGILSRTLIDKYVMIISGPFCILVAALLNVETARTAGAATVAGSKRDWPARVAGIAMGLGWIGCAVNYATERNWSSLRWLDPFESVTRRLYEQNWHRTYPDAVCSHPSARYYFALHRATDSNRSAIERQIQPVDLLSPIATPRTWFDSLRADPSEWLACYEEQDDSSTPDADFAVTPRAMAHRLATGERPTLLMTLETAGFAELTDWIAFRQLLAAFYEEAGEPLTFHEDELASWKDRIDPAFRHPQWRIIVRTWRLQGMGDVD